MKNNSNIAALVTTQDGDPFVFWDPENLRLLIRHGRRVTTVYYDSIDAFSCSDELTIFSSGGRPEEYLYSNGRIVASYLKNLGLIVIKRDGEYYTVDAPVRPVGYSVQSAFDTPDIISYRLPVSQP